MMTSTSSIRRALFFAGAAALALAACGPKKEAAAPADNTAADESAMSEKAPAPTGVDYDAVAAAAVADPGRPEDDRENDMTRKPDSTLAFMEVAPGDHVFELEAGGGYYTELLSRAVGPDGSVVMQNPESFLKFVGDAIKTRLADDRLANVRQSLSPFDSLDASDASMDLVTWIWGPHELFYHPDGASFGDPAKSFSEIYRILKPGGVFAVIDHSAEKGAPETTGNDLHRIDEGIIKNMAETAGFKLDAEDDFLANPDDPLTAGVFDPSIRGHTDQFALRFKKPE